MPIVCNKPTSTSSVRAAVWNQEVIREQFSDHWVRIYNPVTQLPEPLDDYVDWFMDVMSQETGETLLQLTTRIALEDGISVAGSQIAIFTSNDLPAGCHLYDLCGVKADGTRTYFVKGNYHVLNPVTDPT